MLKITSLRGSVSKSTDDGQVSHDVESCRIDCYKRELGHRDLAHGSCRHHVSRDIEIEVELYVADTKGKILCSGWNQSATW